MKGDGAMNKQGVEFNKSNPQLQTFHLSKVKVDVPSWFALVLFSFLQVPNLFAVDEKQEICERMRVLDRQRERDQQTDGSSLALFNMFIERCRTQLHVVVAMSPIGDTFRNRLRRFPALINCCTIDWFQVCVQLCVCAQVLSCVLHIQLLLVMNE